MFNLAAEHNLRADLRALRERLNTACGSDYGGRIDATFDSEGLKWEVSLGSNYSDTLRMKGEVLEELVSLIIDTYNRRNGIKLRELEAPKTQD